MSTYEALQDPASGLWNVYFDGAVIACTSNADCPSPTTYCSDVSVYHRWLNSTQCCCDYNYGATGPWCASTSASGAGIIALSFMGLLLLVWPVVGNTWHFILLRNRSFKQSLVFKTSLATCAAGSAALAARLIQIILLTVTNVPQGTIQVHNIVSNALVFCLFLFHTASYLTVAIVWLEASDRAQLFFASELFALESRYFKYVLYVCGVVFIIISAAYISRDDTNSFAVVGAAVSVFIVALFIRGFMRLGSVVHQLRPLCIEGYGAAGTQATVVVVLEAIENIRKTALRLIVSTLLAMANFLGFAVIGGSDGGDTPGASTAALLIGVAWVFLSLSSLFLTLYLDVVARSKQAVQSQATSGSSAADIHALAAAEGSKGG